MKPLFFKLVQVPEAEIMPDQPFVSIWNLQQDAFQVHCDGKVFPRKPDHVIHVIRGSVGTYNMEKLLENIP